MKKRAILALALAAMLAFGAGVGTMAWFTSTATSDRNVFQTGTLTINGPGRNQVVENVVDITNIYPGWEGHSTINVRNTGSLAFKYKVSVQSRENSLLYNGLHKLQVKVNDSEFMPINEFNDIPLGIIANGGEKEITFEFNLPTTAGNEYQNLMDRFDFVFEATQLENNEPGWKTYVLVKETASDTGRNQANKNLGNRPYFEYQISGNKITLDFHNPSPWFYAFDYRIDGEEGRADNWTNWHEPIRKGDLIGQEFGVVYNLVSLSPGQSRTVTVTATEELLVGLRRGGEQSFYFDWIRFEVK